MDNIKIPHEFICPITLDIMREPVICEDGFTYEKSAIKNLKVMVSPLTRQSINLKNLKSNDTIKKLIEDFVNSYGIQLEPLVKPNSVPYSKYSNPLVSKYFVISIFSSGSLIGIKVRGVFNNLFEAEQRAKVLQSEDSKFNLMIGSTNKFLPCLEYSDKLELPDAENTKIQTQTESEDFLSSDSDVIINGVKQRFFSIVFDSNRKSFAVFDGYPDYEQALIHVRQCVENTCFGDFNVFVCDLGLWCPFDFAENSDMVVATNKLNYLIGRYKSKPNESIN